MSKYRCRLCGSPHREPAATCRQCGASMRDDTQTPIITKAPRTTDADRLKPRGALPYVLAGLLIVVLIAGGAIALGLIESDERVDAVVNRVVPIDKGDGWITFEEPNGVFAAETPGELEVDATRVPLTDTGTTTHYTKQITDELAVGVAYTEGADLPTDDPYAALAPVVDKLTADWNGHVFGDPEQTSLDGRPALAFVVDEITIDSVPYELYCHLALLDDGDVLLVSTLATGDPPQQHDRILRSFLIEPAATEADDA